LELNSNLQAWTGYETPISDASQFPSHSYFTSRAPGLPAAAQSKPEAAGAPTGQAAATPARITQAIDETQLVRLRGNVHPLARPEFDQGVWATQHP